MRYLNIYRPYSPEHYRPDGFDLVAMEHETPEQALAAATPKFDDYVLVATAVPIADIDPISTALFPQEVFA